MAGSPRREVEMLRKKLQHAEDDLKEAKALNFRHEQEKAELRKANVALQSSVSRGGTMEQRLAEAREALEAERHQRADAENIRAQAEEAIAKWQAAQEGWTRENKALKADVEQLRTTETALRGEVATLRQKLDVEHKLAHSKDQHVTTLERELSVSVKKCNETASALSHALSENAIFCRQNDALTAERQEANNRVSQLLARLNDIEGKYARNEEELSERGEALMRSAAEANDLRRALQDREHACGLLETEAASLREHVASLDSQCTTLRKEALEYQKTVNKLHSELSNAAREKHEAEIAAHSAHRKFDASDGDCRKLQFQLQSVISTADSLRESLTTVGAELDEKRSECHRLAGELSDALELAKRTDGELSSLHREHTATKVALEQLRSKLDTTEEQLTLALDHQQGLADLNAQKDDRIRELERTVAEMLEASNTREQQHQQQMEEMRQQLRNAVFAAEEREKQVVAEMVTLRDKLCATQSLVEESKALLCSQQELFEAREATWQSSESAHQVTTLELQRRLDDATSSLHQSEATLLDIRKAADIEQRRHKAAAEEMRAELDELRETNQKLRKATHLQAKAAQDAREECHSLRDELRATEAVMAEQQASAAARLTEQQRTTDSLRNCVAQLSADLKLLEEERNDAISANKEWAAKYKLYKEDYVLTGKLYAEKYALWKEGYERLLDWFLTLKNKRCGVGHRRVMTEEEVNEVTRQYEAAKEFNPDSVAVARGTSGAPASSSFATLERDGERRAEEDVRGPQPSNGDRRAPLLSQPSPNVPTSSGLLPVKRLREDS